VTSDLGTFAFLPWLRRGVATQITRANDSPTPVPAQPRGTIEVTVPFGPGNRTATARGLALLGPGEVVGLDPSVIVRVWPKDGTTDVESNYFPLLELGQPDLPWRYTPARADLRDRLRPWCCLVAVADDPGELVAFDPAGPDRQLAVATLATTTPLPKLAQSWAWAHVEVAGVKAPNLAQVTTMLATQPSRLVARLLCPRRLNEDTWYRVLLVPAFRRGVLAGLGEAVPADLDGMAPAWPDGQRDRPLELPVYHHWRFKTGPGGDFEGLVGRLQKLPLPAGVGRRDMDARQPGGGLPAASAAPLGVEGALRADTMQPSAWDPAERTAWTAALGGLLARPERLLAGTAGTPRQVALPFYGRWHAALRALSLVAPPAPPGVWAWHQELNADPRLRVAAALGTLVVQAQQQQLMAGAWRQVEGIRRINQELRLAQLAREQARRIYTRHLVAGGAAADPDMALMLTAPVHGRVPVPGVLPTLTVWGMLRASPIDPGVFQPQFRRISRPYGPLGRRQGRQAGPRRSDLLDRLNHGLAAADPPPVPAGLARFGSAGLNGQTLRPDRLQATRGEAGFIPREILPTSPLPDPPPVRPFNPVVQGDPLRTATVDLFTELTSPPQKPPDLSTVDVAGLAKITLDTLNPAITIGAACGGRVEFAPGQGRGDGVDELEPVLAAPKFPQPMFAPLRDLSQDWLLPGLGQVPPNSVSLAVTNQRFIEAYLVGLNHEMGRELLWNGFPTDQRGTYFDRFWDPSGSVRAGGVAPPDIDPIAEWPGSGPLGRNAPGAGAADEGRIVLLLRGDLLRRYPTSILYAARAKPGPVLELGTEELHPSFSGTLQPDVSFFGFELTADGAAGRDGTPGWYFVFQEQPSETRFGLDDADTADPMATWQNLTWAHMGAGVTYIDLDRTFDPPQSTGGVGWNNHAADMAVITSQQPVRVAIHGARLLPTAAGPP
jgi:hypothetical protein